MTPTPACFSRDGQLFFVDKSPLHGYGLYRKGNCAFKIGDVMGYYYGCLYECGRQRVVNTVYDVQAFLSRDLSDRDWMIAPFRSCRWAYANQCAKEKDCHAMIHDAVEPLLKHKGHGYEVVATQDLEANDEATEIFLWVGAEFWERSVAAIVEVHPFSSPSSTPQHSLLIQLTLCVVCS